MSQPAEPLELVYHPDPVLRKRAKPIATIDDRVRRRAERMVEVMFEARGIGLAAPQVGWSRRLVIICPTAEPGEEIVLVNPEVVESDGEETAEEGCLSFPQIYGPVTRPDWIRYRYQTLDGETVECEADGLHARVVQHEIDHVDGIVFTMRMSPADRLAVKKAVKALEKRYKEAHGG